MEVGPDDPAVGSESSQAEGGRGFGGAGHAFHAGRPPTAQGQRGEGAAVQCIHSRGSLNQILFDDK